MLKLSDFNPSNEAQLEDWVDKASTQATKARVCLSIFQDVWVSVAIEGYANIIESISTENTLEDLCSRVALYLFPASDYVRDLEHSLLQGQRQETVLKTQHTLLQQYSRYCRLTTRRNRTMIVHSQQLLDSLYSSLPRHLEYPTRTHFIASTPSPDEVIKYAFHIEQEYKRCNPSHAIPAYPANPLLMEDVTQQSSSSTSYQKKKDQRRPLPAQPAEKSVIGKATADLKSIGVMNVDRLVTSAKYVITSFRKTRMEESRLY